MRDFRDCVIIALVFFVAALALLEVDRRCADMYRKGGVLEDAAVSVNAMVTN